MRRLLSILQKFIPKQPIKPVGRWSNEYCDIKTSQRVDLSNEDHCGPCGQYVLGKLKTEKNTEKNKVKFKNYANKYDKSSKLL